MPRNWNALSPNYRRRLERGGITEASYSAGANLQKARGQSKEARVTATRREAKQRGEPIGPSPSVLRSWRRRAANRNIEPADWERAIGNKDRLTFDRFRKVQEAVKQRELAHREWIKAGAPNAKQRREARLASQKTDAQRKYVATMDYLSDLLEYDDYIDEWGESWGYYH